MSSEVVLSMLPIVALAAGSEPRWSYAGKDGPVAWSRLHKDYAACGIGQLQSPINSTTTQKKISRLLSSTTSRPFSGC